MKLNNFEEVKHLINTKAKIEAAIQQCDAYEYDEADCGGTSGAEFGYWGVFSKHSDGSGDKIDLHGCYVEEEVVEAIKEVLDTKRTKILARLGRLGVDVSADDSLGL